MTDLTGTQISSLLETLPGIAQVLRSPVADAFVGLIRASSGQGPFNLADAEEVMRYAVRRNLIAQEESERILVEVREAISRKPSTAAPAAKRPPVRPARPKNTVKKHAAKARTAKRAPRSARKVKPARVHRKK